MKLEDLTKEELIYLIERDKWRLDLDEDNVTSKILLFRMDKSNKISSEYGEKSCKALDIYANILKPFEGQKISSIPNDILKKSGTYFDEFKKYSKLSNKESKKWERIYDEYKSLEVANE